jgi:hypothetical protein
VRRGAVAILALAGASCSSSSNAYLELTLDFPPDPRASSGARHAVVGVVSGDVSFDEDWKSTDPIPATKLGASATTSETVSVEGRAEIETTPVRVKVRFCRDATCTAVGDDHAPEVRFEIERAFYLGERTSLTLPIACIPNVAGQTDAPPSCPTTNKSVATVAKCSVAGCREGVTRNYCASGKHFCEK